jgi:prevent-host-death family protein
MEWVSVSIAEGKKNFSKLIRDSEENKKRIVISRRGVPVAVILPYADFVKSRKEEALKKINKLRLIYQRSGIAATDVYEISRNELDRNP